MHSLYVSIPSTPRSDSREVEVSVLSWRIHDKEEVCLGKSLSPLPSVSSMTRNTSLVPVILARCFRIRLFAPRCRPKRSYLDIQISLSSCRYAVLRCCSGLPTRRRELTSSYLRLVSLFGLDLISSENTCSLSRDSNEFRGPNLLCRKGSTETLTVIGHCKWYSFVRYHLNGYPSLLFFPRGKPV